MFGLSRSRPACRFPHQLAFAWFVALPLCLAQKAVGDTIVLNPSADTTLIEIVPNNNLGAATFFNAGTTGTGTRNRALLLFDLAGSIPANATITDAQLTLTVIRQPTENPTDSPFSLHQVLTSWGEGTKTHEGTPDQPISPGLGSPATAGDGTWNDRFAGMSLPWAAPGGAPGIDFLAGASGSTDVGGTGDYVFGDLGMVSDVQYWLNHPNANFGWMLMSDSEDTRHTARAFASREDLFGQAPSLSITFEPVPEPGVLGIGGIALSFICFQVRRRRTR